MKDFSDIKIVLESSLMTDKIKKALQHQKENIIFIDSEEEAEKPASEVDYETSSKSSISNSSSLKD